MTGAGAPTPDGPEEAGGGGVGGGGHAQFEVKCVVLSCVLWDKVLLYVCVLDLTWESYSQTKSKVIAV